MAPQREPDRTCLVADRDGDVWAAVEDGVWTCTTNTGDDLSWVQLVEMFGPVEIYIPQTGDGAAVAAQSMGGSLPPAVPSSPTGPGPAVIGGQPGPRRFLLYRHTDISHVSGVGVVAWGVEFPDGSVAIRWHGAHPSTVAWGSVGDAIAIHGHSGATEIRWLDEEADRG